jgi:4-amino-4-deoxy-L-arabinose transferase-like glycosyltransferase
MDTRNGRNAAAATGGRRLEAVALVCLCLLAALKLCYAFVAAPLPDEAYYWLWGRHLDWSYLDHPPLQAWVQAAFTAVFGNSLFALRLPALLATAGIGATVVWWVREARLAGEAVSPVLALALFFSSPVILIFTTLVFPDYLAILLLGVSAALFFTVLDGIAWAGKVRPAALYGAALALGLATLTKYNSGLLGLAVALTIVAHRPFRPLLRSPHLYLAALLSVACMLPVLWWNVANGLASLQFHLDERLDESIEAWRVADNLWSFLGNSVLGLSPFLIAAMVVLGLRRPRTTWLSNWRALALVVLVVPTLFWVAFSVVIRPAGYWNIPAYLVFLPLAALWFPRRWVIVAHLVWGVFFSAAYVVNHAVVPLSNLAGGRDYEAEGLYGWPQVIEAIERQRAATGADFVVTSYYRTGGVVAFHTGDRDVEVISERHDQFDFWLDRAARAGQDAIVLTDDRHAMSPELAASFTSIEPLEEVVVSRFGYPIRNYQIMLGRGFVEKPEL